MDVTTINKRTRIYLDYLGLKDVDLMMPFYDGSMWKVRVVFDNVVIGTVKLCSTGEIIGYYPIDK